ncbi:MAG: hypothetical protein ACLFUF_04105 [Opitutales bacterium]
MPNKLFRNNRYSISPGKRFLWIPVVLLVSFLLNGEEPQVKDHFIELFKSENIREDDSERFWDARRRATNWLAQNPDEAIEWLSQQGDSYRSENVTVLLSALVLNTFESEFLVSAVADEFPEQLSRLYLSWVIQLRSQHRVLTHDSALIRRYFRDTMLASAYIKVCRSEECELAAECILSSDLKPSLKERLLSRLLTRWLSHQPNDSVAFATELPDERLLSLSEFWNAWIILDSESAAKFLHTRYLDSGGEITQPVFDLLVSALEVWLQHDEASALAWFASNEETTGSEVVVSALVSASLKGDGKLAADLFFKLEGEDLKNKTAPKIARVLADVNPERGFEWLKQVDASMDVREAAKSFYINLAEYDFVYAVELFPYDLKEPVQAEVLRVLAPRSHTLDAVTVYDWLTGLAPNVTTPFTQSWSIQTEAALAPDEVRTFIRTHPNAKQAHRANHNLAYGWVIQEPERAQDWARMMEGPGLGGVGYGITAGLLALDDAKVVDWIESLPSGPMFDWSVDAYYDHRIHQRPDMVLEYALGVTGMPDRRKKYMKESILEMQKKGILNTKAILNRSDISEDDYRFIAELLSSN